MITRVAIGLVVVLLVAAAFVVPGLLSGARSDPQPEVASAAPPRLRIEVHEVQPRRLTERFSTTGTLQANEFINVVSEVAGKIESISFREGAAVEGGQMLVKIADDELQARRATAIHRLELATSREARQRDLFAQGVVAEQDFDLVETEVNVLRSELRLVDAQLEKTEIRAPFEGLVGLRFVSEGSFVSAQTRITTLQDLDPIKIDVTLPERFSSTVKPGKVVDFRVDGSERVFHARIYAVEPRIDPETRSLLVRASSPNPGGELLPGSFADVVLVVADVADALVVPSLAIIPELGGKKVFVIENGEATPRVVETGIRTETEVQILAGLDAGDRVIVSAIQRLRSGLPVEALEPADRQARLR